MDTEYRIITPNYKRGKCENPQAPDCKNTDKLLWIKLQGKKPKLFTKKTLYICAECVKKDYKIVGMWANSWEKDFIVEELYKPNER